eukprot:symbB.v1.2.025956.t1/scaffold2556.1/size76420/2
MLRARQRCRWLLKSVPLSSCVSFFGKVQSLKAAEPFCRRLLMILVAIFCWQFCEAKSLEQLKDQLCFVE